MIILDCHQQNRCPQVQRTKYIKENRHLLLTEVFQYIYSINNLLFKSLKCAVDVGCWLPCPNLKQQQNLRGFLNLLSKPLTF